MKGKPPQGRRSREGGKPSPGGSADGVERRSWGATLAWWLLFGGIGLAIVVGAPVLGLGDPEVLRRWLASAHGPWVLPAVVAAFAVLAFVGAPQIALIAAAVVVLGPERGALYSWVATMVSAAIGFGLGRIFGVRLLSRVQGPAVARFMAALGRNGFVASLLVRLAPLAPFAIVNIAAGATPMSAVDFLAGAAIGIVPKIVLTAFAGGSALRAVRGGGLGAAALAGVAVVVLIAAGVAARRWIRSRQPSPPDVGEV